MTSRFDVASNTAPFSWICRLAGSLTSYQTVSLPPPQPGSTTAWFKAHPAIEVTSRDRGADYATAASAGATQAVQVADRWHLVHNLCEALSLVLEHYQTQLRRLS
jgi:transposase